MKDFYYYQYTDDGITWVDGDCGLSLMKCVDRARRSCYRWRILNGAGEQVPQIKISSCLKEIEILEQIFK